MGIALLVILVVVDIGVMFLGTNIAMYKALKPVGLQGLLILNAATTASVLVFLLGFATALSTYCLSSAEGLLLSLPIKPRHLLGAKISTVYLSECLLAFLLMATALGVFAFGERPPLPFYLFGLLSVLAVPLLPIAASYLILVPLMSAVRFLRNKNAVMLLGGFIGLAFALIFNFTIQSAATRLDDAAWILANYAGPDAFLARAGRVYLPALLLWKATTSGWLGGLGFSLANLALGLLVVALPVLLLGPAYASSLSRFGENKLKKLKSSKSFIAKTMRKRSRGLALFTREFNMMNREPVYFFNGPMIVLLMPVILVVALAAQASQLTELKKLLGTLGDGPYLMLIAAAFGAFLGSSTSITCTAISRDAKALHFLKALPIPVREYAMAKFFHGFAFTVFGGLVGALGLGLFLGLSPLQALGALFIALSLSALINAGGLWLDTINPRLAWDSPMAALKQNPNSVIVILAAMGILGGLGALSASLKLSALGFVGLFGLLPALLAALALAFYPRYAEKKIASLEV